MMKIKRIKTKPEMIEVLRMLHEDMVTYDCFNSTHISKLEYLIEYLEEGE